MTPGTASIIDDGGQVLDLDVVSWRYEELERAGYPVDVSITLSAMADVNLHVACDLLKAGATVQQALRILT